MSTDSHASPPAGADAAAAAASYTILRVKRKRHEEPLDALVFDAHTRKRTKDAAAPAPAAPLASVFQFATTVERGAWQDGAARRELQDRIAVLVQEPGEDAKAPLKRPAAASPERAPGAPRKYVIVENKEREPVPAAPTSANVAAAAAAAASFNLYDVVPAAQAPPAPAAAPDPEIERFLPMLQEYLKVSDIALSPKLLPSQGGLPTGGETRIGAEAEDDYVWDVYYYRPSLTQWNALALGANVGSLNGLPPSINDPNGSDSESEPEDEDDEDSNEEGYYKNDYPDEDSDRESSGDEFHEDSDYDDFLKDAISEEEHDWR